MRPGRFASCDPPIFCPPVDHALTSRGHAGAGRSWLFRQARRVPGAFAHKVISPSFTYTSTGRTTPSGLTRDAKAALMHYDWRGNARELRNALERAAILCEGGLITTEHLIAQVLAHCGGDKSRAAASLGISRTSCTFDRGAISFPDSLSAQTGCWTDSRTRGSSTTCLLVNP